MIKHILIIGFSFFLFACASALVAPKYEPTTSIKEEEYRRNKESNGLVLVAATGKRVWGCGSYENAELRSIGFDRLPSNKTEESPPDLVINTSDRGFMNYAYLLPPGTYAISYINIKVARSMSDVGYITANRSSLVKNDGGSFTVGAGENVYIGHFGIDCAYGPSLWRYYSEDQSSFNELVSSYKANYPYLSLENVSYRLFSSKDFGHEFKLQ